jgi:hypothetical protein
MKLFLTLLLISATSYAMDKSKSLEQLDNELKTHVERYVNRLENRCKKIEQDGYYHGAIFCANEVALVKGALADLMKLKEPQAKSSFYANGLNRATLSYLIGQKNLHKKYTYLQ